ncbi:MAG: GTP 3',8-cyclase MoaA [Pseudomonadota bacterium]
MPFDPEPRDPTPADAPPLEPLIDPFARAITYLRVSVTDRCDLRCAYCMSEHMQFLPKAELLTLEELDRLCSAFIALGVTKLRVTGGEPLVRRDVMRLFERMGRHLDSGALKELTLTTNGTQLRRFAPQLASIGVRRVNVSLDTLDERKFHQLTRTGRLAQVLDGIDAAQDAGLSVKINCVALKGVNEAEVDTLLRWCGERGFDLTFIEVMPMGEVEGGPGGRFGQYWPLSDLRAALERNWTLTDTPERTGGPARYARCEETGGRVGFITPLTHNFCEGCNRVRLTCTGRLYMCLGQEDAADFRALLRDGADDAGLVAGIRAAIRRKPKGHDFDYSRRGVGGAPGGQSPRHMSHTGG